MKKILLTIALIFTMVAHAEVETIEKIAAVVNDKIILKSELDKELEISLNNFAASGGQLPPKNIIKEKVLEHMIIRKLQLSMAEKAGINIDDQQLDEAIRSIAKKNNLTIRQLAEEVEKQGGSFADFRESIRIEMITRQLQMRFVSRKINISEKDVENYLLSRKNAPQEEKQYKLAHILIEIPEAATPEEIKKQKELAEEVKGKLEAGEDFTRMAVSYSDSGSALKGGVLDWMTEQQVPSIFAEAVPDMKKGELSGIIQSPSGFHIFKILDIKGNETRIVEQNKVRHILIMTNEITSDDQAKQKLEQLKERIIQGDDFAKIASANSDDKASAADGGEMDWAAPGLFVPEFQEQVDRLKINELSPVFKSRYGWHLLQVVGRRKHDDTEEYKRTMAMENIRQQKMGEAVQLWLRQLRDEAYIEIR
ncbi:MAG: molecular chaperone SurA [Gammaproteobacteria bacterium]|nr:MAG: molecular chaperone SurA [Gammaproteobacteria bacterium]